MGKTLNKVDNRYDGEILTREEACRLLRMSRSTLWKLSKSGKIPAYRIGPGRNSALRFKRSELLEWLDNNRI